MTDLLPIPTPPIPAKRIRTPGSGRKPGVPNKATKEFRNSILLLLEGNRENYADWLASVAAIDPGRALDLIAKLAEYAAPKLSRSEHTGDDGGPMQIQVVRFGDL
jgi:hypothetical protein